MGLPNRHESGLSGWLKRLAYWKVAILLIVICTTIDLFGDMGREALKYDRLAISGGEYWRLVTGHFAHLSTSHLMLNLAGLVLSWLLVGRNYSTKQWLVVLLIIISAISSGFWILDENMLWYVGLSGILHGLMISGAIQGLKSLPAESAVICLLVVSKLIYEQLFGPLPGSESVSGGEVVVNAHLYGAIGGAVAAGIFWRRAGAATAI
jgi:rhomboid family GlyGly-CTERM serine protease